MKNLRILVVDDHEVVRRGLVALLGSHAGWEVCAQGEDGRDAVELARELKPDIVILDVGMPMLNGVDAARKILAHNPKTSVLILTLNDTDNIVQGALDAGVRAFVLKSDPSSDVIAAVEALERKRTFFTARVAEVVLSGYRGKLPFSNKGLVTRHLSPRERQVLQIVAEGNSSKQVAAHLGMSPKTAETHRTNIMKKLGLHSVTELVLYAIRNDIIQVWTVTPRPKHDTAMLLLQEPVAAREGTSESDVVAAKMRA